MVFKRDTFLFTIGMAFYWPLFVYQIFPPGLFGSELTEHAIANDYRFFTLLFVIIFTVLFALVRKFAPVKEPKFLLFLCASCGIYSASTVLFFFFKVDSLAFLLLYWVNLMSFALIIVLLTMLWAYSSEQFDSVKIRQCLPLSMLISVIIGTLLQQLSLFLNWDETAPATIFPLLSCLVLFFFLRKHSGAYNQTPSPSLFSAKMLITNSYFIALGILILYLLSSGVYYGVLTQGMTHSSMQGFSHKAILLLLVLAMYLFLRRTAKKDTIYAYPLTFFITLCIAALYCVAIFGNSFSEICRIVILPTRACAIFLAWMVVGEIARQNKWSFSALAVTLFLPLITLSWIVVFQTWNLWVPVSAHDYSDSIMLIFALMSAFILMLSTFSLIKSRSLTSANNSDKRSTIPLEAEESHKINELRDFYNLSARETEVLELLSEGHTKKKIAEILFVSVNSVQTYSKNLYAKLGVHNRQEIVDLVKAYDLDPKS